jgi:hypothetical protein
MTRTRGAVAIAAATAGLALLGACGGAGGAKSDGGAGADGGARDVEGVADGAAAPDRAADADGPGGPVDAGAGDAADVSAVDQAGNADATQTDVAIHCPMADGGLAPADPALVIDDFSGSGLLDGRVRATAAFTVKEQFDTTGAMFVPTPEIEPTCGAAAPGAAYIRGHAGGTGATFALVFSTPAAGGKPLDHYDASATSGLSFNIALGDAGPAQLITLQVNLAQSPWDYTKDVPVAGTAWQTVTIPWSDLEAAPGAPAFSAAALNQIVFPFFADTPVDLYMDDLAFTK